jgi:hypothetical protein
MITLCKKEHVFVRARRNYQSAFRAARHHQSAERQMDERLDVMGESSHTFVRCARRSFVIASKVGFLTASGAAAGRVQRWLP